MSRSCAAVLALAAGCGFHTAASGPGDGGPSDGADGPVDSTDGPIVDMMIDGPPTPLCNPADLELRACFAFENNLQDGSAFNHDATGSGAAFVSGHSGQGVATVASDLRITPGNADLTVSRFTLRVWVRVIGLPGAGQRAGILDSTGYRIFMDSAGIVRCAFSGGGGARDVFSATGLPLLTWTRVSCVYDGANLVVYFNGAQSNAAAQTTPVDPVTGDVTIGQNEPNGENFNGVIDDLQIWSSLVAP